MIPLVRRSFGRVRAAFTAVLAILVVFQFTVIAMAAALQESGDFEQLARIVPAAIQPAIAPALMSFSRMTMIGYFEPLIVILLAQWAIYVATEPAGEIESGLIDLILSRPMPRRALVTRSILVTGLSTSAIVAAMCLGTWAGLAWLAPAGVAWPEKEVWSLMVGHLLLMTWAFGAIGLAVGCWTRRRGAAIALVTIVSGTMWLLDLIGLMWPAAEPVSRLTLIYYFHGGPIIAGVRHTLRDFSVLGGVTLAATALAYWRFTRRDL